MATGHNSAKAANTQSAAQSLAMHCDGGGEGAMPNDDPTSHGTPEQPGPGHSHGCQPMAACASAVVPVVNSEVTTSLLALGARAITLRIQVLASLTFPPEPPPPKA